ncbi:MAG: integrase [Cytophagales bacterium]|nr:MAG: integrase [Cytophagales bacterium]
MFELYKQSFLNFLNFEKRYSSNTILSYKIDLEQFFEFILKNNSELEFKDITYMSIRAWIVDLSTIDNLPRTINRKIACLKSFFKYLMREKKVEINPASRIKALKIPKKLPVFIEENHLENLLETQIFSDDFIGVRDKLILELFYATGIRLSELIDLKTENINLFQLTITVIGKGNKQRTIPLHKNVIELIKKYNLIKNNTFTNSNEKSFLVTENGEQLYPVLVQRLVKKYLNLVSNADKKSPHILRHSFATHILNHGAELNAIKDILGHTSLAATQIYTHNSMEKLKKIFEQAHPKA